MSEDNTFISMPATYTPAGSVLRLEASLNPVLGWEIAVHHDIDDSPERGGIGGILLPEVTTPLAAGMALLLRYRAFQQPDDADDFNDDDVTGTEPVPAR